MTKENAHIYLPLVQALADGELQFDISDPGKPPRWSPQSVAEFNYPPERYRRKPKPREWWANIYPDGRGHLHTSQDEAEIVPLKLECNGRTIRVREVIE